MTRVQCREEIKRRRRRALRRNAPAIAVVLSFIVFMIAVAVATLGSGASASGEETVEPPAPERELAELAAERTLVIENVEKVEIVIVAPVVPEVDAAMVDMLACAIYTEAGGNACSDLCRKMVGDVVLNRMEDPRFPDTMEEVLTQERQYSTWHWTGIQWPERASHPGEAAAVERAYDTARSILEGEHSSLYGQGYIWQAEFSQGSDVILLDGIYFGR